MPPGLLLYVCSQLRDLGWMSWCGDLPRDVDSMLEVHVR